MTKIHQLFLKSLLTVWISYANTESDFSYYGTMGPDHWSEHYNQCSGKHQSPININDLDVENKLYSDITYHEFGESPSSATLVNNGHTVLLQMSYDGKIPTISNGPLEGKGNFQFQQLHFHWGENNTVGSEDRINNVSYPMELHVVFRNEKYDSFEKAARKDDGIAVLAAFYEVSVNHNNENYHILTSHLKDIQEPHTNKTLDKATSLYSLLNTNMDSYYTYIGSLTTPPCSEEVIWIDFVNPIKISPKLIELFRYLKTFDGSSLTHNFRPVQPLNNRKVYKVTEKERIFQQKEKGDGDIALINAWDMSNNANTASISLSTNSPIYCISILLTAYMLNTLTYF